MTRSFKKQQRLVIVSLGLIVFSLVVFTVIQGLGGEGLNLFLQPQQVKERGLAAGTRIRLGGLVVPGSLSRAADGVSLRFTVTDCKADMDVSFKGLLPDLFREGQAIVSDGVLAPDGHLLADRVLAKHDENYAPPGALVRDKEACKSKPGTLAVTGSPAS